MRPIDADALKIKGFADPETGEGIVCVQDIDEAPTLDVAPVVHGRWIIECDDFDCELMRCSVCGEEFYDGDNDTVDTLPNYCPNCGAKMDMEDK